LASGGSIVMKAQSNDVLARGLRAALAPWSRARTSAAHELPGGRAHSPRPSFLTGFFGQNLGWLISRIGSLAAFLIFGIGTELLAVICPLVPFRRRGWMGKGS
jgi:hypothetical protein